MIDIARWSGWASYVMETPTNDKEPNGAAPDDDKATMKKLFASYHEDFRIVFAVATPTLSNVATGHSSSHSSSESIG